MKSEKLYHYLIIAILSGYIVSLYYTSKLTYYIHPRYIELTYGAALLGLTVGAIGSIEKSLYFFKQKKLPKIKLKWLVETSFLIFTLLAVFTISSRPLSSATAQQRAIDFNNLNSVELGDSFAAGFNNTQSFTFGDWIGALNSNPNIYEYDNKEIEVTGFILTLEDDSSEVFTLSRFVVTCCAVDARPVGLKVRYAEWEKSFKKDQWVRVVGETQVENYAGKDQLLIIPAEIEMTEIPDNPYLY